MRIHPFDQAPILPEDVVFRPSRLWMLLGVVICAGMTAITFFLPGWIRWICATIMLLILLWVVRRTAVAFSAASWVLRYSGRRILIKIGSPFSHDLASVFVAEFQASEIEWVRSYQQVTVERDGGRNVQRSTTWLELKPRDSDLEKLRSSIQAAIAPKTHTWKIGSIPMSVSSSSPSAVPVSVTSDGIIRVEWSSPSLVVAPFLKRALRLLENEIPVQPKVSEHNDFTKSDADQAKMEQQIVEYVAQGQIVQATKLARQRYGYSLTEARQFVADLQGKDSSPKVRDPAAD